MKIKIAGVLILLTILISEPSHAQKDEVTVKGITYINKPVRRLNYFPDSIRIEFPDLKTIVVVEMKHLTKDMERIEEFPNSLSGWLTSIEKSLPDVAAPRRTEIQIKENGETQVTLREPSEKITQLTISENTVTELLPPGWELFVKAKDYKIYVYAQNYNDLVKVSKKNFHPAVEKVMLEKEKNLLRLKSLKSRIIMQDDKVVYSSMKYKVAQDYVVGDAGAGLGFLGDKFYPELNVHVSLRFGDRFNRVNHKVTFTYNNLFLMEKRPEGGYQTNLNSFLSLSWNKNWNFDSARPSWIGVGAGLLVSRQGDYFVGKTMKIFIKKSMGDFNVIPELYLTDDFKKPILGIKLNYTF